MARVYIRHPVTHGPLVVDPSGVTCWGEGLDTIDPTVTLTPVVKAAFATKAPRVLIKGPTLHGYFQLLDEWAELEQNRNGRLVAHHFCVYEFRGWQPNE